MNPFKNSDTYGNLVMFLRNMAVTHVRSCEHSTNEACEHLIFLLLFSGHGYCNYVFLCVGSLCKNTRLAGK